MLRFIALAAGLLFAAVAPLAQTPAETKGAPVVALPAQPQGVYATINLAPTSDILRRLETQGQRYGAAREVLKDPAAFMPQVLYAVANVLSGDRPEEAIFWYHVGRVRAVYDAFRCKDNTARNVIPELGKRLSVELVRSQYYQREHLVGIAQKAIDWDARNPRNYDQRWVCLFGRVAQVSPGTDPAEVQKPESEWPAILQHIHEAHLKSVQDFASQPAPTR
jgi:hypothetical protein